SVTPQEEISGSFTAQDRYRRQYAGEVAGHVDDMRWLTGGIRDDARLNMLQRVGATRVVGKGIVGVSRRPGCRGGCHGFNDGTKADGIPDDRFVLLAHVDALGVAATFNVEYGAWAPAVLIVTNQVTVRIGGESGLACAGQAKEQAGFAGF